MLKKEREDKDKKKDKSQEGGQNFLSKLINLLRLRNILPQNDPILQQLNLGLQNNQNNNENEGNNNEEEDENNKDNDESSSLDSVD